MDSELDDGLWPRLEVANDCPFIAKQVNGSAPAQFRPYLQVPAWTLTSPLLLLGFDDLAT